MKSSLLGAVSVAAFSLLFCPDASAESTGLGKIDYTQGHVAPNCRTVRFTDNTTGAILHFRIQDVQGKDDVAAIVLAALISKRDVSIYYEPAQTTGCGTEPRIIYITVY